MPELQPLTATTALRVSLAALAGVALSVAILSLARPPDAALLIAAIAAAIATLAIGVVAGRSLGGRLERRIARAEAERRDAEDARANADAERGRFTSLLDEIGEAIFIADASGRIEHANRSADELFGAALAGRRVVEVVREHELLEAIASARPESDSATTLERVDPPRFQRAITRRLPDGRVLLVLQDLTALRRLETVRSDFVANVSHELRTPLASLKAIAETLEAGALEDHDAARDFVRRMKEEIDGLTNIVEELLLISELESGQQVVSPAPTPAATLLASAAGRLAPLVERAGIRLIVDPAERLPSVLADRERVSRVFANLVHNATKHTPAGGEIHLAAARGDGHVAFTVRDTGEGIAGHDLDRIFERFYKADRSRADGGSGLGLSIAKHIVEAHGGTIRAASDGFGRGTTFTFTLRVAR